MAKSKSLKESNLIKTPTISVSGAEAQVQDFDPALISLFAQSLGAVKPARRPDSWPDCRSATTGTTEAANSLNDTDRGGNGHLLKTPQEHVHANLLDVESPKEPIFSKDIATGSSRYRKRKNAEDDLEGRYMSRLAREEVEEGESRARTLYDKRQKLETRLVAKVDRGSPNEDRESMSYPSKVAGREEEYGDVPQHESLVMPKADSDLEKSSRTVFLANVSTMAIKSKKAKKTLMDHLSSFTSSLQATNGGHNIESLRFRSIAFAASGIPKKAAFVKKEIMDSTARSTNAYVVYTTELAAREAVTRLNGSIVLDRHLRVDSVAHPAKIDHRRCVFVGNLGFVDDETSLKAGRDEEINKRPRKTTSPADVEEGLWRQFEKAGVVECVRVIRDKTTRVGKGFAYVQYKDANSVEKALLYHEKRFPPMLPRILRVTRAKNTKNAAHRQGGPSLGSSELTRNKPKVVGQDQSLTGRAHKLLGRAGAAKLKATGGQHRSSSKIVSGVAKLPDPIVFEGYRASSSQRNGSLKRAGSKHNRPSKRSKDFRTKGRKRTKL